jgi:tripeptidyl-peptidase-1
MIRTSASTPLVAGMIALLNSLMLNNNKAPLGLINPLLYKMATTDPTTFTDITSGNNMCTANCCTSNLGFTATTGWDPVSGLGTPVFSKIQNYLQKYIINK